MSFIEQHLNKPQIIGSHTFSAEDIINFARKYDPQPFHVDAEAAEASVFGALCASGWHTTAVYMKLNVASIVKAVKEALQNGEAVPAFGPSPGFDNLKWHKPVFAGDTITYERTIESIRPLASRPGWSILTMYTEACNQNGEKVLSFNNAAMVKLPQTE